MKKLKILLMCLMAMAGTVSAVVVNVDFGTWDQNQVIPTRLYTGQGAFIDHSGSNFWNHAGRGWEGQLGGNNLTESDGTTATTIGFLFGGVTYDNYTKRDPNNLLLDDGRRPLDANPVGFTISGLVASKPYKLYLYGGNRATGQGTVFTFNGVTGSTTGLMSQELVKGGNYVILQVTSDATGAIVGSFAPLAGQTDCFFNGFQIADEFRGEAHTPAPKYMDAKVDSEVVKSISWYSPEQDDNGAAKDDPNLVTIHGYKVWFGTKEPNETMDTPTLTTAQNLSKTLTYLTTYYWRVDTEVTWNTLPPLKEWVKGKVWQFTTLAQYKAPVISKFDSVITTSTLLPAVLSATVTNNSQAITSVTFTMLTGDYQFPDGANFVLTNTSNPKQNPTATLTSDKAGTYKVKLVVSDGPTTVEKIAQVDIYADACAAKKATGTFTANVFDRNSDCFVDVKDLLTLAQNWLNDTTMKVQENY